MFNKILYFGAGTHLEPIIHFSETSEFVFGDSMPRTEFGFNYYKREYYRKYFLSQLEHKITELKLTLCDRKVLTNNYSEINVSNLESECLYLSNFKYNLRSTKNLSLKNIKYYISTALPYDLFDNNELQHDIETCDSLLICGHHPNIKIIKYLKKPFNIIGYSNTWFPKNINELKEEDSSYEQNILTWITENPYFVKSYTAVNRENGEKYIFNNYKDFCDKIEEFRIKEISAE
jgi:hypothetical protein